jgi:hypothetical protein
VRKQIRPGLSSLCPYFFDLYEKQKNANFIQIPRAYVLQTCTRELKKKWLYFFQRIRKRLGSDLETNYSEFFMVLVYPGCSWSKASD